MDDSLLQYKILISKTDLGYPASDLSPRDGQDFPVHEAVHSVVDTEGLISREDAVPEGSEKSL
jgi:hypothetical protein